MNANIILPTLIAKSAVGIHSICFKTFSTHILKSGFCLSESKLKKLEKKSTKNLKNSNSTEKELEKYSNTTIE